MQLLRVAGIAGILSVAVTFSTLAVALAISPWFDWNTDALSFLGMTDRPSAPFFNGGLILGGILALTFSLGLVKALQHPITRIGTIVLAISSIALAAIGVFPYPGPSHVIAAAAFFFFLPISLFVIGAGLLIEHRQKFGIATISAGVITIILFVMIIADFSQDGSAVALPEAIFSLTGSAWIVVVSIMLLKGYLDMTPFLAKAD